MQTILQALLILFIGSGAVVASAQDTPTGKGEEDVESLYDQLDQQSDQSGEKKIVGETPKKTVPASHPGDVPTTVSDLNELQPFQDIAVIEKRYLPKTGRFELSGIGLTSLNNPFFNNLGGSAKLAFYFSEQWAAEAIGTAVAVQGRQVTQDLRTAPNNITTSNVVTARNFVGGAIKWNPIYGKISFLNHSIVPFDLNFSAGGGMTMTDQKREEATVHLGAAQIFALSKSFAFRWDIDWNFYNAQARDTSNNKITTFHNDLFLGIGLSVYFPEASYR